MMLRVSSVVLLGATILGLNACKPGGSFKKTDTGLEYNIVKDEKGTQKASIGDAVTMHIHIHVKDSVLFDSRKMNNNEPIQFPMPAPSFKGDVSEGFMMLTPGDSAIFRISLDSLKKAGAQMLPWMKEGDKIEYNVVMVSIKSQQAVKQEQEAHASEQKVKDDAMLQEYFTKNGLKPTKTPSGLYYIIEQPGSGENAKAGQVVTVNYTGRTMDGRPFDSNVDPQFQHAQPFSFMLGQGSVIPGWDEGVMMMNKGSKAKLFIPSTLAYGSNSPSAAIPKDAILMFDIEVTKIEAAPAASANSSAPQFPAQ